MSTAVGRRLRVVVVGGGIAGLTTAIEASEHHDVVLVTKGSLGESTSQHAQGGVAVEIGRASCRERVLACV